ncbi:AMP-binding protein, partial [Pseudomonas viridiflava]
GDMAELALVSEQERTFLIEGCNQSEHAYPLDKSYVELFEVQVAAHPERIAVSYLDREVSYAELNIASNRLGHALIEAGVGFDQPLALLAERGPE